MSIAWLVRALCRQSVVVVVVDEDEGTDERE